MDLKELILLKESEDKVEFKEAKTQYSYNSGRKSVLGYIVALANEGGGMLVFGIKESSPYQVVGSKAYEGKEGQLEQNVYRDLKVRVQTHVLTAAETGARVLVVKVPPRPIGKPLYFADVPLMRVGDRLERMADEVYLGIIQEQEPDFSALVCPGLCLDDLDDTSLQILKKKYSQRQNNPRFLNLSTEQILIDLGLSQNGRLTYAALILLGRAEAINRCLPQAKTIVEYRSTNAQIESDWRTEFAGSMLSGIDEIWSQIHSRNRKITIRQGPYVEELLMFNEEVIREAVLNAITHRDYSFSSETVIKQTPTKIQINNPGGFPKGVVLENILTVSSTPRSRLLADVLLRIGLVERSGQGVDKIFAITLSEGKYEPNYSASDYYQVSLVLDCEVKDLPFQLFLKEIQNARIPEDQLGVPEIISLAKIRDGYSVGLNDEILGRLESEGLIVRIGSGNSKRYLLGELYQNLLDRSSKIGNYVISEVQTIVSVLEKQPESRMRDFVKAFEGKFNRSQVKYLVDKLLEDSILEKNGRGSGTKYQLCSNFSRYSKTWTLVEKHLRSMDI